MAKIKLNAQYNVAKPESLPLRVAARMRRRMYEEFLAQTGVRADETILDVGATSDTTYDTSNYLEAWYPHRDKITAAGIDDAHEIETWFPGVTFVRADGRDLPFDDNSYDVVHSSAVLEHVGSRSEQLQFISELARVARRSAFLTTPNRWFPVEVHTVTPFLHWMPPKVFRAALRALGHDELAQESNLNLLGPGDLKRLCRDAGLTRFEVSSVSVLGWPSNLLLKISC